jgi:hypothetical protein
MYAIARCIPEEIRRAVAARTYFPEYPDSSLPQPLCAEGRCALSVAVQVAHPGLLEQLDDEIGLNNTIGRPDNTDLAQAFLRLGWIDPPNRCDNPDRYFDPDFLDALAQFINDFDKGLITDLAEALGV